MDPNAYYHRSEKLEQTAFLLSIFAVASFTFLTSSMLCGSLAIILALLSKGGCRSITSRAAASVYIASAGLMMTLAFYLYSLHSLLQEYGSWEGILQNYLQDYGPL